MNVAVLLAAGIGKRLNNDIPKQFVKVFDKPIIVYAAEIYQKSLLIDAIEIVCLDSYIDVIRDYVKNFNLTKVKWVTSGGSTCQESIKNGIFNLSGICKSDDVLLFSMSTSVFVSEDIIEDSLHVCQKYGNAFAAMQCIYNNAETFNGISSDKIHYKETHKTLNLPWTSTFGKLERLYKMAYEKNIETSESSYMPTLFLAMGEKLYFSKDTSINKIHLTTPEDLEIIKAIINYQNKN